MHIERLKRTRLGRLWLAAFVALIWRSLYETQRARLRETTTMSRGHYLLARKRLDVPVSQRTRFAVVDSSITGLGLAGELVSDHRKLTRRKLTPLGVEVFRHGCCSRTG
jgi:hypothetical protein